MAKTKYRLTQTLSDGTTKNVTFLVPMFTGNYNLKAYVSNQGSVDLGTIYVNENGLNDTYRLRLQTENRETFVADFKGAFGLSQPVFVESSYKLDTSSNSYFGSLTVRNDNNIDVTVVTWYRTKNPATIEELNFTMEANSTKVIWFSDIQAEGIYVRVNFVDYARGLSENEVYNETSLGTYTGSRSFGELEETTTTTDADSAGYALIESDGNFTLWRKQDVE